MKLFQSIDKDDNIKVSKEEMANFFESSGKEMTEEFWTALDPDGDRSVTLEEWVYFHQIQHQQQAQLRQQQQQQQKEQSGGLDVVSLFESMDGDKDGKLNKEELGNMFKSMGHEMTEEFWLESDPDGDGFVTFEASVFCTASFSLSRFHWQVMSLLTMECARRILWVVERNQKTRTISKERKKNHSIWIRERSCNQFYNTPPSLECT
jgi:hypothetical protein